ncbi:MAG: hypothetical protein M1838_003715 [Thelocarpon superellum]|nr:MAG: hypothetical protein M1838_003715 [Thelocarpon superellum]
MDGRNNGNGHGHGLDPVANTRVEDLDDSFPRLLERLGQIPGYMWDDSIPPFHSSYGNWHIFGRRTASTPSVSTSASSSPSAASDSKTSSSRSSPRSTIRPSPARAASDGGSDGSGRSDQTVPSSPWAARSDPTTPSPWVVARISSHALRLEREHYLCLSLLETADPEGKHVVRPFELVRLAPHQGDRGPIVVSIVESPGRNYLMDLVNFGPAWYRGTPASPAPPVGARPKSTVGGDEASGRPMALLPFLDFAIGASECLELLHHGQRTVHAELRGDAFHFNVDTGLVKLINFGAGPRSFENGILTSARWSTLSREVGVKTKLQFVAPEQTGRMIAAPDSRTDIYSLGVLCWSLLTAELPFDGSTPMDVVQGILSRRIPPVTSKRLDVPDVLSAIIQKMTMKQIDERYHSATGLKHDLQALQKFLGDGDGEALKTFKIATRDVSSYLNLPTQMFGRQAEHDQIVRLLERVSRRSGGGPSTTPRKAHLYSFGSTASSSVSEGVADAAELADGSSDGASSHEVTRTNSAGPATPAMLGAAAGVHQNSSDSQQSHLTSRSSGVGGSAESVASADHRPNAPGKAAVDHRSPQDRAASSDSPAHGSTAPTRRRSLHRLHRKGRCEVISIAGAAGLGKSCLVQSVQTAARRCGYTASTKFDQAKKQPFEPVLRLMASLFRQIFSESDIATDFHHLIRSSVKPVWPLLHVMLDIPEHLLGTTATLPATTMTPAHLAPTPSYTSLAIDGVPSKTSSQSSSHNLRTTNISSTADFLRDGSSTKSLRFMNTFLDVLRLLSQHKFICLCLEDLQFADEESLELLTNIVAARIKLVVIATYRQEEMLGHTVRSVLESDHANITRIELTPLGQEEIVAYVATALYRPREYVVPLAGAIREKTDGNPFEIREMLSTAYRKNCLWYDWKSSCWHYDLDRIFREFETDCHGDSFSKNMVIRRLTELPPASRSILAWASLLGVAFSFSLVQKLMTGEFDYREADDDVHAGCTERAELLSSRSADAVAGLQAALQAYILIPGEEDDQFRFAHDRYMQASVSLRECQNITKMHFLIAQTMMKYHGLDDRDIYVRSSHVCQSVELIKRRVAHRSRFRELLFQAGQKAGESGARASALYYYQNCLALLQPDPWSVGPDVYYDESLQLFTRASECLWLTGRVTEALDLLQTALTRARSPVDRAPSWVLQSRILAQSGNPLGAFQALKQSLSQLGLQLAEQVTWERCDADFGRLCDRIKAITREELLQWPLRDAPDLVAMGAILVETVSAAFWSNSLLFYQTVLKMVELHLDTGAFTQVGLGYLYLGTIAVSRHGQVAFGLELSDLSRALNERLRDTYALGRGHTTYWLMLGHLQHHLRAGLPALEGGMHSPVIAGDRILSVLNMSAIALTRLSVSHDLQEIESFCSQAPDEVREFGADLRGGALLLSVRQVARALQGKTRVRAGAAMLSDEHHDSAAYLQHIRSHSSSPSRALDLYNSLAMIPLYLYEQYDEALRLSAQTMASVDDLWTMRATRLLRFYTALALLAVMRRDGTARQDSAEMEQVRRYQREIAAWEAVEDANYGMWSRLLTAEMCDVMTQYGQAIAAYEAALDHAQAHDFVLEEGLIHELMAGFFLRRTAKRAARAFLKDAISSYRRISAFGKADQVVHKYHWLVTEYLPSDAADVACQTDAPADNAQGQYARLEVDENERRLRHESGDESSQDRTRDWLAPSAAAAAAAAAAVEKLEGATAGVSGHGIDVIDLQSILTSSQIISSELDERVLLPKMCELILDGNSADFAAILVEEEGVGWAVAASGDPDGGVEAFNPGLPLAQAEVEDQVSKQIALYCLRAREPVFLQNLLTDERFNHVSEKYLQRNPLGKSVIALPILHGGDALLGALYLEGPPHTFTDRNLTVLQLLVNQMGISISNALLFKRLRKVSAANASMVESQRRALAQARAAEAKAKQAEAEAVQNLRLKEEAAKAKSIFLANVSHELRTPLNGVIGMSELLKATTMTRTQGEYADSIRVCADTLLTVINDILDYSKLEAGKMQLVTIPFNLREAIEEVVRALARTHHDKTLRTVERLALPSTLVLGDPVRIHQILMNLLSNSYKFTPAGTVTVGASVEQETGQTIRLRCDVVDTGIGISDEQLQRLFMPFSQADSSTARRYGGSGLGLSICKSLIGAMGGDIWITSAQGRGTTVSFTLTLTKAPRDAAAVGPQVMAKVPMASPNGASPTLRAPPGRFVDLSRVARAELRICIAEDNPINQRIAISFVQRLGYAVDAYENGQQAVEALRTAADHGRPYHVVLMDVQMPELDGYDATRAIRLDARPAVREVLVIAMTASAIQGDREKCIEAGMNNYLAKPVRANVLQTMLEQYLQPVALPTADAALPTRNGAGSTKATDHGHAAAADGVGRKETPTTHGPAAPLPHHPRPSLARPKTERRRSPSRTTTVPNGSLAP